MDHLTLLNPIHRPVLFQLKIVDLLLTLNIKTAELLLLLKITAGLQYIRLLIVNRGTLHPTLLSTLFHLLHLRRS